MKTIIKSVIFGVLITTSIVSCVPERVEGDGNGLTPTHSDASFTVTKTAENYYKLEASNNNYISSRWNLDDGGGFFIAPNVYEVFIPDQGTYTIQHQIIGQGGIIAGVASQTITVENSDPVAGNLIQGGKFENSDDVAKWNLAFPNPSGTANWVFSEGKATFTATEWNRNVLYQPIDVVAGRSYKVDAVVSSTTGVSDSWFEIYVGYTAPTANNDYTGDGGDNTWIRGINTWAGSGTQPFAGKISNVGSINSNNPTGTFTATSTGTVYFAIRSGGNDMKEGISITNIEFRGIN